MPPELPPSAYDALPYPGEAQSWTHPDRLATKALVAGLEAAPAENCRVLELGCGDGVNVAAMAFGLPTSRFLGIDLARKPIESAVALARKLELKNLEFRCADVLDLGPDLGEFDYITVPGLYSWVLAEVRDKLLELCGACLAPNGVAVVSYNTYPGCYPCQMARDMMTYHVRSMANPETQIRQARGLINILIQCQDEPNSYKTTLERELDRIVRYPDSVFFHDDLNPHYHPVFFHQFVEHAGKHGLQYLADRCESVLNPEDYPEQIRPALRQLDECGVIEREQYLDFILCRRFRCTLLARADAVRQPSLEAGRIDKLRVGLSLDTLVATVIDPVSGLKFENGKTILATSENPLMIAAMSHVVKSHPRRVPFPELLGAARGGREENGAPNGGGEDDARVLEEFILGCFQGRLLDLGMSDPPAAARPSERPVASALARALVRTAHSVPSLRHEPVAVLGELGRRLLELLDGTRSRADLLGELNSMVATDAVPLPDGAASVTAAMLEEKLEDLARLALLTA